MSKHVLIISTSPRKGGNSDVLVDEFARGAQEAGNHVEKVALYDQTVGSARGALPARVPGTVSFTMMQMPLLKRC